MHIEPAGDFRPAQSTGAGHLYALGPGLHGSSEGLFHGSPVGNAALHLVRDVPGHQISIQFGLLNFLDIQLGPFANKPFELRPHFINSLSTTPDDDARPGGVDGHHHLVGLTFNLYCGDGGIGISVFNGFPNLQVFLQESCVVSIRKPFGLPATDDAESKAGWVNFMSH